MIRIFFFTKIQMKQIDLICLVSGLNYFLFWTMTIGIGVQCLDLSPEYTFQEEGTLVLSSELAHLAIEFDTTTLDKGMAIARMTMKHIKAVEAKVKVHLPVVPILVQILENEMAAVEESYENLLLFYTFREDPRNSISTPSSSSPSPSISSQPTSSNDVDNLPNAGRGKRQIGLAVAGIVGLLAGATLNSYLGNDQIQHLDENVNDLNFRQEKLIHLLNDTNQHVRVNREKISELKSLLEIVVDKVKEDHSQLKLEGIAIFGRHLINRVASLLSKFQAVAQAASVQRLSSEALSAEGAREALNEIKRMAQRKGLKPIINSIQHFMELPASYTKSSKGFKLYIHCTLYDDHSLFSLQRFHSLPIALTVKTTATIEAPKELLALGRDQLGNRIYAELSTLELGLCHRFNQVFLCPHNSQVVQKESETPSCLFSLYFSQHEKVLKSCQLYIRSPKNTAVAVTKTRFLVNNIQPATYDIYCKNKTKIEGRQLIGTQIIEVPNECSAQLPDFLLRPLTDFFVKESLVTREWTLPAKTFWNDDMTEDELDQAYETLKNSSAFPAIQPLDIELLRSLNYPLKYLHPSNLVSLSVCAFLLILFTGLVVAICRAYRRDKKKTSVPPYVAAPGLELYPMINPNQSPSS